MISTVKTTNNECQKKKKTKYNMQKTNCTDVKDGPTNATLMNGPTNLDIMD